MYYHPPNTLYKSMIGSFKHNFSLSFLSVMENSKKYPRKPNQSMSLLSKDHAPIYHRTNLEEIMNF